MTFLSKEAKQRWTSACLALVAGAALLGTTGCSRIAVTRTVNPDGTAIDEYRCQFNEKGLQANGEMMTSGVGLTRQIQQIMAQLRTDKDVVGNSMMAYKGEMAYTALVDHAAKAGVLYESENWLTAQKASWTKQADGGWTYELPLNPETLEKAFALSGLVPPTRHQQQLDAQDGNAAPDGDDEGAPPPLFPVAPPPVRPGPQKDDAKEAARMETAWKALEVDIEIVLPGKITATNGKAGKDRTATWTVKPYELLQDSKLMDPKSKGPKIMVLKATCGPALPASKADEERYKKLKGGDQPGGPQELP